MERLEEIRKLYLYRATKNTTYPEVDWLIAEVDRLRTKYESSNPRCNKGHINNLPLALWDCPTCVTELRAALAAKEEALRLFQASTRTYMILVERMGSWTHDPEGLLPEMKRISGELLALSTPTPAEEK